MNYDKQSHADQKNFQHGILDIINQDTVNKVNKIATKIGSSTTIIISSAEHVDVGAS